MAEFHVAMGLIYRSKSIRLTYVSIISNKPIAELNGNEIPDALPAELIPPSARDLDSSVNFLKDVLKNETRSRSPSNIDSPVSYGKVRSFNSNDAPQPGRDATIYKHQDAEPPGGFYQSKFRSVDRDRVRARGDNSPTADLDDVKNMLKDTAKLLDNASDRNDQDAALDEELEDLKFRIKRLQDDLAYVSRGSRTTAKDQERRHIERELTEIMHVKVPDVERKIKDREARRDREKRQWARDRDRTNERSGRYQDRDYDRDRDRYADTRYDDRDRDYRPYSRGPEDRDDRGYRRGSPGGDRGYEAARPSSPLAIREPPPAPPSAPPVNNISNPPPAPKPPSSPAPNMKSMTAQERQAYARAEAQRRIEARKAALGIVAAPSPGLDTSVEDRLQQEKKEAEEKSLAAEKEAEERDRLRKERLDRERGVKAEPETPTSGPSAPATPATPTSAKKAPPVVKARAPAPPPPRRGPAPNPPPATVTKAPPAPVAAPTPAADSDSDSEDEAIRMRQEELRKKKEARAERLRQLEREEEGPDWRKKGRKRRYRQERTSQYRLLLCLRPLRLPFRVLTVLLHLRFKASTVHLPLRLLLPQPRHQHHQLLKRALIPSVD